MQRFMTAMKEGGRNPQGNFHCLRDLVFAPKELQWKLFTQVANELKGLRNNHVVILALPRYLNSSCCANV
jgi:hypothetical protein